MKVEFEASGFFLVAETDVDKVMLGLMVKNPSWDITVKEWGSGDQQETPKKIGFTQKPKAREAQKGES